MATVVARHATPEDTQLEFVVCDECHGWDRGVGFHFPKCSQREAYDVAQLERIAADREAAKAARRSGS